MNGMCQTNANSKSFEHFSGTATFADTAQAISPKYSVLHEIQTIS